MTSNKEMAHKLLEGSKSNKGTLDEFLDEVTGNDQLVRDLLKSNKKMEGFLGLREIRNRICEGELDELNLDQLISAIITDDPITSSEVLEIADKLAESTKKDQTALCQAKFEELKEQVDDFGEAKAVRILAVCEILRRISPKE